MSVGWAIIIVGVLSLFVLGPAWFRKLVLVLGAITIVVGGSFLFVIADPQAVAPVGCKTSWGRSFLPEAACQQVDASKNFDVDGFIAGNCKTSDCTKPVSTTHLTPVPTCTAEQIQTIRSEEKNPFDDLVPGFLFTPAATTGLKTAETIPGLDAACVTPKS
jgi:hypothetical protein